MRYAIVSMLVAVLAGSTALASDQALPHVSVYGTAITEVTPDLLRWRLRVTNEGADLQKIAAKHTEIVADLLTLLKENGIREEKTQTTNMEFNENWEYINDSRVRDGYYALTIVTFEMTAMDKYRDMWITLAGRKNVYISDVSFDISNRIEVQNETRKKALLAAREKAREMAQTLDAEIGVPLTIEEDQDAYSNWSALTNSSIELGDTGGGGNASPISLGRVPVKIRVKVEFRLLGNG